MLMLCVTWGSALTSSVCADVVVLQNGTIHQGQVLSFDNDELVLLIEGDKTIIERPKIASIHFGVTRTEYEERRSEKPKVTQTRTDSDEAVDIGHPFHADSFTLTVMKAEIVSPEIKDLFGDLKQ